MILINILDAGGNNIGENLAKALSSTSLWTAIAKTVIFILLGFFFTKKKLLPDSTGKVLTKFVMSVCLPCLAFTSFMKDFNATEGIGAIVNFVLGFVLYVGFMFLSKLIFIWVKDKKKRTVLSILFAFGSTTFFGLPIVSAVYGDTATGYFNIMNVAYRVFLYTYAYLAIAGIEDAPRPEDQLDDLSRKENNTVSPTVDKSAKSMLKKIFLNPIVIATFAGLILWALQAIPAVNFVPTDWLKEGVSASKVALWRFDVTLPWIYQAADALGKLSSTIILFAIGCTLGGTSIKSAATDKYAWIWTALKVFVAPIVVLALLAGLQAIANATGWLVKDGESVSQLISVSTLSSSVITWMVPPATVAVGYCISFDKEKEMASHISLIGTFGSVIGVVIWVILLTVLSSTGMFYVG